MHGLDFYTKAKYDFIERFYSVILNPRKLGYKIMFTGPTGTNAVEAALKLARKVSKRRNIIAFTGAFHGMTLGSLAVTTDKTSREGAGVNLNDVTFIPYESGGNYNFDSLNYFEHLLADDHSGIEKPAAVIFETVQAEGGVNVASEAWLIRLEKICKSNDIILICDDIQVGCGRTGTFFSFERSGINPDMVILSKSLSGYGFPMSVLLFKQHLDVWKPAEHNGTFRGNQLAFVSSTEALDFWADQKFSDSIEKKSKLIGGFLKEDILPLHNGIKIRGCGLIWAIDFSEIKNINANELVKICFKNKLIIETCGRNDSALKILPALTIEKDLLMEGLQIIFKTIKLYL
ncbi:Diaminobutyrate--2-oxoglutarate transaminase [bioreactor metagenome]|uniref:Diaminobutyrate--2-oxoglutarate transaminase n=1 Tax=bioreactor metagenome TaxID=1076179 RepID=A0A645DRU0_9ZZZZ